MDLEIPRSEMLEKRVFGIHNEKDFNEIACQVYHFQFHNNTLYRQFCTQLGYTPEKVRGWQEIPFLPISFFKTHLVQTTAFDPDLVFKSSGTTGVEPSIHIIKNRALYITSFLRTFESFFGPPEKYCILGLLPSYLEREDSSLVFMVNRLIQDSRHPLSGFYLYNYSELSHTIDKLEREGQPAILFGVTFALLDFASEFPRKLKHTLVLETGGMKGRKRELTKNELYGQLKELLGISEIYSEYGMTELLSQAYARNGKFTDMPPWMKVQLRDETDPLRTYQQDYTGTGAINIIDLANLYSCSFIATEDLGKISKDGSLEIMGRLDHTDIRGCSQLVL